LLLLTSHSAAHRRSVKHYIIAVENAYESVRLCQHGYKLLQ